MMCGALTERSRQMSWLNYTHLRCFWATVREGGVSAASRALHVSQPTVSAQRIHPEVLAEFEDRALTAIVQGAREELFA